MYWLIVELDLVLCFYYIKGTESVILIYEIISHRSSRRFTFSLHAFLHVSACFPPLLILLRAWILDFNIFKNATKHFDIFCWTKYSRVGICFFFFFSCEELICLTHFEVALGYYCLFSISLPVITGGAKPQSSHYAHVIFSEARRKPKLRCLYMHGGVKQRIQFPLKTKGYSSCLLEDLFFSQSFFIPVDFFFLVVVVVVSSSFGVLDEIPSSVWTIFVIYIYRTKIVHNEIYDNNRVKREGRTHESLHGFLLISNCGVKESVASAQAQSILRTAAQTEEGHCRGRHPPRHFIKCPKKGTSRV